MSNSMNWLLWLPAVSALIAFVSFLSMLVYAVLAKSDGSPAKKYVIVGLSIMLFSGIALRVIPAVVSRYTDIETVTTVVWVSGLVFTVFNAVATGFLVAAAFTRRDTKTSISEPATTITPTPIDPKNPYSAPSSQ